MWHAIKETLHSWCKMLKKQRNHQSPLTFIQTIGFFLACIFTDLLMCQTNFFLSLFFFFIVSLVLFQSWEQGSVFPAVGLSWRLITSLTEDTEISLYLCLPGEKSSPGLMYLFQVRDTPSALLVKMSHNRPVSLKSENAHLTA